MYETFKHAQLTLAWLDSLSGTLNRLSLSPLKENLTPQDITKLIELITPLLPHSYELKDILLTQKYNYLEEA